MNGGPGRRRLDGWRVLVVDDVEPIRDAFSLLLQSEGAVVTQASSGRDALDLAARHQFDALLTDLGLPDIPGDVLLRHIVAGATHRPRVVAVTGEFEEPYVTRAREAGAEVVLSKPVTWDRLWAHRCPRGPATVAA